MFWQKQICHLQGGTALRIRSTCVTVGTETISLVLILMGLLVMPASVGAADQDEAARAPASSTAADDYSFDWLDPDKKIYVLQNRRYQKARHILLSGLFGSGFSDAFRSVRDVDLRGAFYLTEEWGIEMLFASFFNSENSTFQALKTSSPNALPVVREFKSQVGAMLHWAPWYAKINVFNTILYFDWYFEVGGGTTQIDRDRRTSLSANPDVVSESFFTFFAGTGHQFHLSQNWVVRLDFLGAFFKAPLFGDQGEDTWYSRYRFSAGIGFRL